MEFPLPNPDRRHLPRRPVVTADSRNYKGSAGVKSSPDAKSQRRSDGVGLRIRRPGSGLAKIVRPVSGCAQRGYLSESRALRVLLARAGDVIRDLMYSASSFLQSI